MAAGFLAAVATGAGIATGPMAARNMAPGRIAAGGMDMAGPAVGVAVAPLLAQGDEFIQAAGPAGLLLVAGPVPAGALSGGGLDLPKGLDPSTVERQGQRHYGPLILSCDLSFKGKEDSDHCGFVLMGLLHPEAKAEAQRDRRANPLVNPHGKPIAPPVKELEIEVLWAARHRFGLPETVRFLLASLAALQQQGLKPDAVLIEDAANGPAVLQLLRRQVPGLLSITARGSKESRAHAVAPLLGAPAHRQPGHAPDSNLSPKLPIRGPDVKGPSIPTPPPMPSHWPMGTWPTGSPATSLGAGATPMRTYANWQ